MAQPLPPVAAVEPDEMEDARSIDGEIEKAVPGGETVVGGIGTGPPAPPAVLGPGRGDGTGSPAVRSGGGPGRDEGVARGGDLRIEAAMG